MDSLVAAFAGFRCFVAELVQPKTTRSRRTVPLPDSIVASLKLRREQQELDRQAAGEFWEDWGLVFTTKVGTPFSPRNDYREFLTVLTSAGLRRVRLHDLRHTAASLMLVQGVPARVVMQTLGHSQISITLNTYSHVSPELSRDAASRMDTLLAGSEDASQTALAARWLPPSVWTAYRMAPVTVNMRLTRDDSGAA